MVNGVLVFNHTGDFPDVQNKHSWNRIAVCLADVLDNTSVFIPIYMKICESLFENNKAVKTKRVRAVCRCHKIFAERLLPFILLSVSSTDTTSAVYLTSMFLSFMIRVKI